MNLKVQEGIHIQTVSQYISAYKRSHNMSRKKDGERELVALQDLFKNENGVIAWFSKKFGSKGGEMWLKEFCNIEVNAQQSRGHRRELWLTKDSKFRVEGVKNYLNGNKTAKSTNISSQQNTTGSLSFDATLLFCKYSIQIFSFPSCCFFTAAGSDSAQTAADTAPVISDVGAPADPPAPAELSDPLPAPAPPLPPAAAAAPTSKMLSRISKAKIAYDKVSKRQKLRVRQALTNQLCKIIKDTVAVDEEYVTCTDILRDVASSVDKRSRKRKRTEQKSVLAASSLVQRLAAEYVLKKESRKDKKRILSAISREFTLKELNELVFLPHTDTKVSNNKLHICLLNKQHINMLHFFFLPEDLEAYEEACRRSCRGARPRADRASERADSAASGSIAGRGRGARVLCFGLCIELPPAHGVRHAVAASE